MGWSRSLQHRANTLDGQVKARGVGPQREACALRIESLLLWPFFGLHRQLGNVTFARVSADFGPPSQLQTVFAVWTLRLGMHGCCAVSQNRGVEKQCCLSVGNSCHRRTGIPTDSKRPLCRKGRLPSPRKLRPFFSHPSLPSGQRLRQPTAAGTASGCAHS